MRQQPDAGEQPRAPRRPTKEAIAERSPWLPAEYQVADAAAIQALVRGDATPDQQKRAVQWIVNECSGYYDISYRPGEGGDRETAFAEGKRAVGAQIVKLSKLALSRIRGEPGEQG